MAKSSGSSFYPGALAYADFVPSAGRVAFPDICCDLVFVEGRVYVNGPEVRSQPNPFSGQRFELLRIDPFAMRQWLSTPLAHIVNMLVPLQDIDRDLGNQIIDLVERGLFPQLLTDAGEASMRLDNDRLAYAARIIGSGVGVRGAAEAVNLCTRQLERLFKAELGVSPRTWVKTMRFRRAALAARRGASLVEAAMIAGYADQAHFTRVSRELTGKSPRALIAQHVAIVQDVELGHF